MGIDLTGTKTKIKKAGLTSDMQNDLMTWINLALEKGEGPLAEIFGNFNEESFNKGVREPALKDFQENVLPDILSKFGDQAKGGSGFRRAITKGATDLESNLAQLRYNAQNQQKQNQIAGVQTGLNKQTHENIVQPGTEGLIAGTVKGVATAAANKFIPGI